MVIYYRVRVSHFLTTPIEATRQPDQSQKLNTVIQLEILADTILIKVTI